MKEQVRQLAAEVYFRLNPECYLVLGKKRSVIHNLLKNELVWLDEENTQLMINAELSKPIDRENDTLIKLDEMGWGFFSDHGIFVDKLRSRNVFSLSKMWKDTPKLDYALLQLINECNLDCTFCNKAFCPTCFCLDSTPAINKPLSKEQWFKIIDDIKLFNGQMLVFTGGEVALYKDLLELVRYGMKKGFNVTISTNGLIPIKNLPKNANCSISLFDIENIDKIMDNYGNKDNVTILAIDIDSNEVTKKIKNRWPVIKATMNAPTIKLSSHLKTDINRFFIRKFHDSCLFRKIFITYDGKVVPCFGNREEAVSNLHYETVSDALKFLIKDYWNKPIEKLENGKKCVECEFKYTCNACKLLDETTNCMYSLEEGIWK